MRLVLTLGFASAAIAGCSQVHVSEDCSDPAHASWCTGTEEAGGCTQELAEDAIGDSITLTLRNDRAVPVWIPWAVEGCTWEPFTLWQGGDRVFWDVEGAWIPSCDLLLEQDCNWGCSDGPANMLRLDPGASWDTGWIGYVYAPLTLDASCVGTSDCAADSTCWAGRQLTNESLEARIRVTEACDATDGSCDCGSAACTITRDSITVGGIPTTEVSVDLSYGSGDAVLSIG